MPLNVGGRLGGFAVTGELGAGGMGVVYRARDTKLDRDVALKVLPDGLTDDPDRLARFEREAKVLASLNHPGIGQIYGIEEADDTRALVLELVEGPTLADRIANGRIPVDEALTIAKQIAEALETAHEQGIIHRDLKPANVKVRSDGTVKVLDFGLAKALLGDASETRSDATTLATSSGTRQGAILGTAAYMSPEQARGAPLDRRTDIWSFACVLFEMLSGRLVFDGHTTSDMLASILKEEPDWHALPARVPAGIRRLLRRCLRKDARHRLHHIADARIDIADALEDTPGSGDSSVRRHGPRKRLVTATVLASTALAGALVTWTALKPAEVSPTLVRVAVTVPPTQRVEPQRSSPIAISPDGSEIVYVAAETGERTRLYRRALDAFDATVIPGTEGATAPFFSADGQWVAFHADDMLHRVSMGGGATLPICDAPPVWSGSWTPSGQIVFSTTLASGGLWRVSANGGTSERLTRPDPEQGETHHAYPQILPGTSTVLFSVRQADSWAIAAVSLETGERWVVEGPVLENGNVRYVSTGHLIYAQSGGLVAVPFDPGRRLVTGPPVPMLERVATSRLGGAYFSISDQGSLVYVPQTPSHAMGTLVLVDRSGRATPISEAQFAYQHPRFSPDGTLIAVEKATTTGRDIWIIDVESGTERPLTRDGVSRFPVWTSDGARVTYQSIGPSPWTLYTRLVYADLQPEALLTGPRPEYPMSWAQRVAVVLPGTEPLLTGANPQAPMSWGADDQALAFQEHKPSGERDIWVLNRPGDPSRFLLTAFDERSARFSPDGRWLAYVSNESGRDEVYVQPYPGPGRRFAVSSDGGTDPNWAPDGRELFFRQGDRIFAVPISTEPTFTAGAPQRLFEGGYQPGDGRESFDVSPDGRHFVMVRTVRPAAPTQFAVVLNWFDELLRRATGTTANFGT